MRALLEQYGRLLQAASLAAVLFALAISLACAVSYLLFQRRVSLWAPAWRAKFLLGWTMLPALGAIACLSLSFMPSFLTWAGLAEGHCHLHPDHPHLCF